ncbi:hypothetical protein SeLEV6574_g05417 [Synchytrium endobioticum]|uniref:BTB domain-containing protein n=1 Tax=Synchytrium endobioticum TaxID=286115 RepID=A0A507CUE4_9FUNG|nr:hypothetical protein SeLEV6574_g05417 [Synchytrium endobioticum]
MDASPASSSSRHLPDLPSIDFQLPPHLPHGPPDLTIVLAIDRNTSREYRVHKAVVTKWRYFEALLRKGFQERDAGRLELYVPVPHPRGGGADLGGLLSWMYGRVQEQWFYASAILDTIQNAGYLSLDDLVAKCYTVFPLIWRDVVRQPAWSHTCIEEGHLSELLHKATQVSLMAPAEKLECILKWARDYDAADARLLQRRIEIECGACIADTPDADDNAPDKQGRRLPPRDAASTTLSDIPFPTLLHLSCIHTQEFNLGISASTMMKTAKLELEHTRNEWCRTELLAEFPHSHSTMRRLALLPIVATGLLCHHHSADAARALQLTNAGNRAYIKQTNTMAPYDVLEAAIFQEGNFVRQYYWAQPQAKYSLTSFDYSFVSSLTRIVEMNHTVFPLNSSLIAAYTDSFINLQDKDVQASFSRIQTQTTGDTYVKLASNATFNNGAFLATTYYVNKNTGMTQDNLFLDDNSIKYSLFLTNWPYKSPNSVVLFQHNVYPLTPNDKCALVDDSSVVCGAGTFSWGKMFDLKGNPIQTMKPLLAYDPATASYVISVATEAIRPAAIFFDSTGLTLKTSMLATNQSASTSASALANAQTSAATRLEGPASLLLAVLFALSML